MKTSLQQVWKEYADYKKLQDDEQTFKSVLGIQVRANVLQHINDLMRETDWSVIDKSVVKLTESKDVAKELNEIVEDHEKIIR